MIFDVANKRARGRIQAVLERRRLLLERPLRRAVRQALDRQFEAVARHAAHGVTDVDATVNAMRGELLRVLSIAYTQVGSSFFDLVEKAWAERVASSRKTAGFSTDKSITSHLSTHEQRGADKPPVRQAERVKTPFTIESGPSETKGMAEEFWRAYNLWTRTQSAEKVRWITETTKRLLRRTLRISAGRGDSYEKTAEAIRQRGEEFNGRRATRIARTEVHAASTYAMDESVRSTRVPMEREWVAVMDERTRPYPWSKDRRWDHRHANGQRRPMGVPFDVSGEKLMHPGDPKGSAGNVIQCR